MIQKQTAPVHVPDKIKIYTLLSPDDNGTPTAYRVKANTPFDEAPGEALMAFTLTVAATRGRRDVHQTEIGILEIVSKANEFTFDEMVQAFHAAVVDPYLPAEGVTVPVLVKHAQARRDRVQGNRRRYVYEDMLREISKNNVTQTDLFVTDWEVRDSKGRPTYVRQSFD